MRGGRQRESILARRLLKLREKDHGFRLVLSEIYFCGKEGEIRKMSEEDGMHVGQSKEG